jgi:rsbT co-antagonist protein RsbR
MLIGALKRGEHTMEVTDSLQSLGQKIIANSYKIAGNAKRLRANEDPEFRKAAVKQKFQTITEQDAEDLSAQFISYLGEALFKDKDEVIEKVSKWGKDAGEIAVMEKLPLEESLKGTSFFRLAIWDFIDEEVESLHFSTKDLLRAGAIIDPLLDRCVYCFSLAYVKSYNENLKKAQDTILELTVPIVPLTDDVAVVPLVGNIEEDRLQHLMSTTLHKSIELKVSYLILDVSGVPVVDTNTAKYIMDVIKALELIGVEAKITGIRPIIAQTVTSLGIEFKNIDTYSTLKQALNEIGFIKN